MNDDIPTTAYGDDRCAAEWALDTDGGRRCEECGGYGRVGEDGHQCPKCEGTGEP